MSNSTSVHARAFRRPHVDIDRGLPTGSHLGVQIGSTEVPYRDVEIVGWYEVGSESHRALIRSLFPSCSPGSRPLILHVKAILQVISGTTGRRAVDELKVRRQRSRRPALHRRIRFPTDDDGTITVDGEHVHVPEANGLEERHGAIETREEPVEAGFRRLGRVLDPADRMQRTPEIPHHVFGLPPGYRFAALDPLGSSAVSTISVSFVTARASRGRGPGASGDRSAPARASRRIVRRWRR